MVVIIGFSDSKKCVSCCPNAVLWYCCSFFAVLFLYGSSLVGVPLAVIKGKMSSFFFFLTKEEAQKYV